jgi:hypothetical protein
VANEMEDVFVTDNMDDALTTSRCAEITDYVCDNYLSADAALSPKLWAAVNDRS